MKKRFITLGLVCLLITGCQAAHETIPEATTIAPIDSAYEETETNNEERAEDASVAAKELKAGSSKRNPSAVKMDYGTSAVYSKKDMDAAIKIIIKEFETFEGCELHSLSYASDEECNTAENIAWMNQCKAKDDPEVFTQCIAFDSSFHSPKTDSGAWNPDEECTDWYWWLARSDGGEWKLMTYGYA